MPLSWLVSLGPSRGCRFLVGVVAFGWVLYEGKWAVVVAGLVYGTGSFICLRTGTEVSYQLFGLGRSLKTQILQKNVKR